MSKKKEILLSYYGDDFTGSSDVLESLSLHGIPTVLFLEAPQQSDLENFSWKNPEQPDSNWMAFGVAGISRSLKPEEMEKELRPAFQKISRIPARYFHYKICSTLDSSPDTGNIGKALEIAENIFPSEWIPMVMGLPVLNRFVVFGNLFARIAEKTYRLDRHPVMSKHPITPMHESDIRIHLSHQTKKRMDLMDIFGLGQANNMNPKSYFGTDPEKTAPLLLFDTLEDNHLEIIGNWIAKHSRPSHQLCLGSSAVEYALGSVYGKATQWTPKSKPAKPCLVVAGSCSQHTADQIQHAASLDFHLIHLNGIELYQDADQEEKKVLEEALRALEEGKNTIIYSALGPNDPWVQQILKSEMSKKSPHLIAEAQGRITKKILETLKLQRLVTAGGDTSGYILKSLQIKALEFLSVLAPGAPLCIAHSEFPNIDGLEIAIKGGQNGNLRYFEYAQQGGLFLDMKNH